MSEAKLKEAPPAETPIWEGLVGEDGAGPYIVGGECGECGGLALGVRTACPHCLAENRMTATPIGRSGTLYTATVIHQGPEGFASPFRVGYVDVEGDVRVFAHLDHGPGAPKVGDEVDLTIAPLRTAKDGSVLTGPFYVAAKGGAR